MTQEEAFCTVQSAALHGGSFIKKLAAAWFVADADNKAKIFKTWPELIANYGPGSALYEEPKSYLTLVK